MGQQFQTDELLLARAEANGYKRGAHKEADGVRGREKHVTKTIKDQDRTLDVISCKTCFSPLSISLSICANT